MAVFQDKTEDNIRINREGFHGSRTFHIIFSPPQRGEYVIPPVQFNYFDPEKALRDNSIGRVPSPLWKPKSEESTFKAIHPASMLPPLNPGAPASAIDIGVDTLRHFADIDIPGTWTTPAVLPSSSFYSGDFLNGDFSKM